MNKVLILVCSMMLLGLTAFAQDVSVATDTEAKKCIPTKECAEKMGMTLEECKKVCGAKGLLQETSVASATSEAELSEVLDADPAPAVAGKKKACCASTEECAKKMGMTIEECKAKCKDFKNCISVSDDASTNVAAASAEAVVESGSVDKKVACCAKGSKKSCSKK